jgi:hypothetical protein
MKKNRKEKRSTLLFDSTNNSGRNGEEKKSIPIRLLLPILSN